VLTALDACPVPQPFPDKEPKLNLYPESLINDGQSRNFHLDPPFLNLCLTFKYNLSKKHRKEKPPIWVLVSLIFSRFQIHIQSVGCIRMLQAKHRVLQIAQS
jgi:hypothetical protein